MSESFSYEDAVGAAKETDGNGFSYEEATGKPAEKGVLGHARDLGLSALKSAIAVPEAAVGLADIVTGGEAGKFLANEGGSFGFRPKEAKEILSDLHTDQYKAQQQEFQDADGVIAKTGVALQNPSLIANTVVESAAPMLAGGAVARGVRAVAPKVGAAAAGAIGEGTTMAGSQAEAIRQETEDGLLTPVQTGAAVATGALGTLFGYLGGRVAQHFGFGDVDTMIARGVRPDEVAAEIAKLPPKSIPRQVVEGAIAEGFLEELPQSISEQIIQNLALGKPWADGVEDAAVMGTLAGMAMGGGASLYNGMTRPATPSPGEGQPGSAGEPGPAADAPPVAPPAAPAGMGFNPEEADPALRNAWTAARVRAAQLAAEEAGAPDVPQTAPPDGRAILAAQQEAERLALEAEIARNRAVESPDDEILQATGRAPLPSEQMGLNPAAGPLSAAAALAVDTGATGALQQAAQAVDPETGEILQAGARVPEQKQDLTTPEQIRERLQYIEHQARANGGWSRPLVEERDRLRDALAKAEPAADHFRDATKMVETAGNQEPVKNESPADTGFELTPPAFDQEAARKALASRTPEQLQHLAEKGRPGWKEAALAEIERRGTQPSAATLATPPAIPPATPASAASIKDVVAKKIPDMTDAELQQAIAHYGPEHKRTAKLQKEAQKRAAGANPAVTDVPPAPQQADEIRRQLREVEDKIIAAAPGAMGAGGGDIEAAMKSRKVPVTLKAQRKRLKEQLQAVTTTEGGKAGNAPQAIEAQQAEAQRAEAGGTPQPAVVDRAETQSAAAEEEARAQQEKERRAQADSERDSFALTGSDRAADMLAAQGQAGLFDGAAASSAEQQVAIERHGLPADTTFKEGKGLAAGKWIAQSGEASSNPNESIDAAAADLKKWLDQNRRAEDAEAKKRETAQTVAEKLRRGEQPTDAELKLLFGLEDGWTYVKQPAVGWFLVEYMGVPRHKIRASLGKAAGTVTSDSGTKYPIVYPRKLHEVFAEVAQAGSGPKKPRGVLAKKAEAEAKARADYFTPGNVVPSYGGFDRVLSYQPPDADGRWSVTVRAVEKQGDAWVDKPDAPARTHATPPGARELKAGPAHRGEALEVPTGDAPSMVRRQSPGRSVALAKPEAKASMQDSAPADDPGAQDDVRAASDREAGSSLEAQGLAPEVSPAMRYRDWPLLDALPAGWWIDKTVGSPLAGYSFAINGSILRGGKRALVRVNEMAPTPQQISQVDQSAFVPAPDGSLDFGEITPEMALAMRRQAGKIRLQNGVQNADGTGWGLSHIEANHGDQIRNAGFESVQHFVSHVARNFNEVLQAKNRQLLVAIDGGRQDVMFVQLEPEEGGDFYRINTAFPASRNYLEKQQKKGMKLLWGGSEPAPAAAGQQPPYAGAPAEESGQGAPIARGQSSDASLAPTEQKAKNEGRAVAVGGTGNATVDQSSAQKAESTQPAAKIEDFGEKIGGARKDVWSGFKDDLNAVSDEDIASQPLSKIWPAPDYDQMIEGGKPAEVVATIRALRDEIPTKPRQTWKVRRWADQVKTLREFANDIIDGKVTLGEMRKAASENRALEQVFGRIDLYMAVGHAKSLQGVRLSFHHYTLYKGQKNVSMWSVEQDAKATAWSNWPRELATGKTKEEAIAAFKSRYEALDINAPASKQTTFEIYSQRGAKGYWVGKKVGRNPILLEGPFDDIKAARAYKDANNDKLVEKLEKAKAIPSERRDTNEPRVGVDMRNGQDVTPELFAETFGFRGVEFGNWVEGSKRQKDLNEAFDALMDMAAILNVPPKALSLNGELGLAFGARGKGGIRPAKAHYEPGYVVINMTKKDGAGSLGHEWWHALDNYFSRMRGKGGDMMTEALDVSLASRGSEFVEDAKVRKQMIEAFGNVMKAINRTALRARSAKLDERRAKAYWTTGPEMSARAFESFLISKLQDQNASNDYLANIVDEKTWKAAEALGFELDGSYPYPTAGEVPAIRAAFDEFFATVQTRETEKGVALFSFAGRNALTADRHALASAQRRIAVGEDAEAVRQDTGWHRGADGRWRFEISDDQARLMVGGQTAAEMLEAAAIDGGIVRVADVLDHPQLFAAYPHLADIRVEPVPEGERAAGRLLRSIAGTRLQLRGDITRQAVASVMLHELQHAIQHAEGFAIGGSKKALMSDLDKTGAETYRRLAGEVEARNTQTRQRMTGEQRRAISPELTADVPTDEVIVTFNGRAVDNAATPKNLGSRLPVTERGLLRALDLQFKGLVKPVRAMLARGRAGKRGGLVMIDSADPLRIAHAFASRTGRALDGAIELFSEAGNINGFYDPKSGLTFLVGPNLDPVTAPAVLLHEMIHGQQRAKIDARAMDMLRNRGSVKDPALRGFLDRVAERMLDAGAANESKEAAAYIVEQAVIEGRSQGFTMADSRFLGWVDSTLGQRIGDLLRSMIAAVRGWMMRNGLGLQSMTVDDLVGYAMAGLDRAAGGAVEVSEQNAAASVSDAEVRALVAQYAGVQGAPTDAQLREAVRKFRETEVAYGGRESYERAKADGQTKLNYRQWVLVRTPAFKAWFGDWENARVSDGLRSANGAATAAGQRAAGDPGVQDAGRVGDVHDLVLDPDTNEPRVFFHGTRGDIAAFDLNHRNRKDAGWLGRGVYVTSDDFLAESYSNVKAGEAGRNVMPLFVRASSPYLATLKDKQDASRYSQAQIDTVTERMKAAGHDGAALVFGDGTVELVVFDPAQVKSAIGNIGTFDPSNPDIRFSRSGLRDLASRATAEINQTLTAPGKVSWWHKTIGTMYNLAERAPAFKPVFQSAQGFIDDVSHYAADAAERAPKLLPRLDTWRDILKTPISAEDNAAVAKPVFEGTLAWTRDAEGRPVRLDALEQAAESLSTDEKAQELVEREKLDAGMLRAWRGMPADQYAKLVNSRYESEILKPGVVWTDDELRSMFKLNDAQIALYREFRAAVDRSLDTMARAEMLRFAGEDLKHMRDDVMEAESLRNAAVLLVNELQTMAQEQPDRAEQLLATAQGIVDRRERVEKLQAEGYAPLSRFGKYTVDVVVDGNREYFGLFETAREANKMADRMRAAFGAGAVTQGTLSDEAFKLFAGITPESLELFGNMLGLDSTGDEAQDRAFQEYLRLTKTNRSALRRLIHRKGIAGFSEDVGRVLASFVYSNARQTAAGLHMGDLSKSVNAIPKEQGELKDVAVKLAEYIKNPQEEAQAIRGLLFAQYLGGSVASAFVNMTQPAAVTFPWLSQYGGAKLAAAEIGKAAKQIATRGHKYEPDLAAALKKAEEDGVVSPQEVHQLMAQARGSGSLKAGDGTRAGNARALASNSITRLSAAWGKLFSAAEQLNRRMTFIAAYRVARQQGMASPEAFARRAVQETQFVYSKASKMQWGRGAVGGTLMTFKTYSVAYLELMSRLWSQGEPGSPERAAGRKAVALMLGMLLLMGGGGGLPFMEDAEDLIDGIAQIAGYNFSVKKARQQFLIDTFGADAADFIERGVSGLPGVPLDVSGRLGLGNLIPGTGIFLDSTNHTRDVLELLGPVGDFGSRIVSGTRKAISGDVAGGLLEVSPVAVRNVAKGVDMAATGQYRDYRGYKVLDTTDLEAAFKAAGFQPAGVAKIQDANYLNQRAKDFYSMRAQQIRSKWAEGIYEKDAAKVQEARDMVAEWNRRNPMQPMIIRMPDILRRVREMGKDKSQRIADTAPRAMRQQLREELLQR